MSNAASQVELIKKIEQAASLDIEEAKKQITTFLNHRRELAKIIANGWHDENQSEYLFAQVKYCNDKINEILAL